MAVSPNRRTPLTVIRRPSEEPMSILERQVAEDLLARLVARAYAADHPELFGPRLESARGDLPHDR